MNATMKKRKPAYHKPYDEEYKRQAVDLVISSGRTCEQVARDLGCSAYSLHLWKKQYLAEMAPREVDGRTLSAEELERENQALRKQVHYLERQREILSLNRASFLFSTREKRRFRDGVRCAKRA
jgi:transposase